MFQRLSKTNTRVQHHADSVHARAVQPFQAFDEKVAHFLDDVRVNGIQLHRLRSSLHVHADITGFRPGRHPPHLVVGAIRRDVVDDAGAGLQRRPRHRRLLRVD